LEGGGLYLCAGDNTVGTIIIENSTFSWNNARRGGGLYVSLSAQLVVKNTTITNCSAAVKGGGVYAAASHQLVEACVIAHNHAGGSGGGLVLEGEGTTAVVRSVVAGNRRAATLLWVHTRAQLRPLICVVPTIMLT
jgi:hypothetical protein